MKRDTTLLWCRFVMTCFPTRMQSAWCASIAVLVISLTVHAQQKVPIARPNVLMIVADDMNWDSPGCFGGIADQVSPNIDKLADDGMRFWHAYVNISICTPSRSVMLSGLYPINNGAEGFQRIEKETETLPAVLSKAGFLTGIVGKPLRQQELFRWSVTYRWQGTGDEDRWGRDPAMYRRFAKQFFGMARVSQQPFFLMANSHDPHRPFAGGAATNPLDERASASREYKPDEVYVPGFLPDLPGVRRDLAGYATSVRRLDDTVGAILEELKAAGFEKNTIVMFLSDHGMPFPGAKFNCYRNSVRTPLIIKWPGRVEPGAEDRDHLVAAIDFQSTILDAVGIAAPKNDGRSFLELLDGKSQSSRDHVFAQFHHIHGADALPMRSLISRDAMYVFNPWSNGKRDFPRLGGEAFRAMQTAAKNNRAMAARIRHLKYRTVEEFYDLSTDPNALHNLFESTVSPSQKQSLIESRKRLRSWMESVGDPALAAFDAIDQPAQLETFVREYRAKAALEKEALKTYEEQQRYRF